MADVADAAGVGRATLYRYFPSRELLLQALVAAALDETCDRLDDAGLTTVPVAEGIARAARALVTVRAKYEVLLQAMTVEGAKHVDPKPVDPSVVAARLTAPLHDLFARGIADGSLRGDLTAEELLGMFGGLVHGVGRLMPGEGIGVEKAAALITSVFLTGAGVAASGAGG